MKQGRLAIIVVCLLLAGCQGLQQQGKDEPTTGKAGTTFLDETRKVVAPTLGTGRKESSADSAITKDKKGSLNFDLSSATQIKIESGSGHEGVIITNPAEVKDISGSLTVFSPYNPKEKEQPEYDYTVTFYNSDNKEIAKIKAYDNFIIGYEGKLYYDKSETFYLWKIRKPYIEGVKDTFSVDGTVFHINGEEYDLKKLESGISSIMKYDWFGDEELPDPQVLLVGYISPYLSYGVVFDVEKMDYIFKTYGTDFTYKDNSAASLIYIFQDTVYNYWGSSLYHNMDNTVMIDKLNYSEDYDNLVEITLKGKTDGTTKAINRLNYFHITDPKEENDPRTKLLSELKADLSHNGTEDLIRISGAQIDPDLTYLDVFDSTGKTRLWTETAHPAHAGWNSVYLCSRNGEDYLLVLNPYQSTGLADYSYVLFYMKGKNKIDIVDSGAYSFSYGAEKGSKNSFDEAKFRTFADQVNTYLKDCYLLMSTEGGALKYSTPANKLLPSGQYETEQWLKEIKASLS